MRWITYATLVTAICLPAGACGQAQPDQGTRTSSQHHDAASSAKARRNRLAFMGNRYFCFRRNALAVDGGESGSQSVMLENVRGELQRAIQFAPSRFQPAIAKIARAVHAGIRQVKAHPGYYLGYRDYTRRDPTRNRVPATHVSSIPGFRLAARLAAEAGLEKCV